MKGRFRLKTLPYQQELGGIAALAAASLMAIALISAKADDPSIFCWQSSPVPVHNWLGIFGAHIAALLLYLGGVSSFILILMLGAWGLMLLLHRSLAQEWDRFVAGGMLFFAASMASAWYCLDTALVPGGLVGGLMVRLLVSWCDAFGTWIIIHGLLGACLLLLTRVSFLTVLQWLYARRDKPLIAAQWLYRALQGASYYTHQAYMAVKTLLQGDEIETAPESLFAFEAGEQLDPVVPVIEPVTADESIEQAVPVQQTVSAQQLTPASIVPVEETPHAPRPYKLPEATLFEAQDTKDDKKVTEEGKERARVLEEKLSCFGVHGKVVAIRPGPVVTLYEYEPAIDTKLSKIIALEDDLALALQATSIRILAPIPGTAFVGFEVANNQRKAVPFANMIRSKEFKQSTATLPLVLGVSTTGVPLIADLARMPHLLVAGSTGSGKSVALHTMLTNLLLTKTPDDLQLILIDPKRLEFACYADVPHLLFPVVTDPRMAIAVLRWAAQLMDSRYERMAHAGVRSVADYRASVPGSPATGRDALMPYIVIVIDEFADLMMTAGSDVEDLITRLSQMARAAGIHVVLATQRPSVDVITGLIKVNFPSRIALRVTSKIDSRTILDCSGADKLLGRGDQLFLDGSTGQLHRIHGSYISDREISVVVAHVRAQRPPNYLSFDSVIQHQAAALPDADDELYDQIVNYLAEVDEVSISMVQRRFKIGYNRSARIIEALQAQGKIMPAEGSKPRKVVR